MLSECKSDIICVSEHWLKEEEIEYTQINNYSTKSYYSRKALNNGGVLIMCKNKNIDVVEDYSKVKIFSIEEIFECCAVKCTIDKDTHIIVIALYRSPSSNIHMFLNQLELCLSYIFSKNSNHTKVILCGDFNIDSLCPSKTLTDLQDILNSFCIYATMIAQQE